MSQSSILKLLLHYDSCITLKPLLYHDTTAVQVHWSKTHPSLGHNVLHATKGHMNSGPVCDILPYPKHIYAMVYILIYVISRSEVIAKNRVKCKRKISGFSQDSIIKP